MNEKWAQFTDLYLVVNCRATSINDRDHKWLHCSSSLAMFVLEWGDISCHISHKLVPAFFVLEKLGDGFGVLRLVRRDVANCSHTCRSHIHPVCNCKDDSVVGGQRSDTHDVTSCILVWYFNWNVETKYFCCHLVRFTNQRLGRQLKVCGSQMSTRIRQETKIS